MRRLLLTAVLAVSTLLLAAPAAFAYGSGQGYYGETDDQIVTKSMFYVIIFFPTLITVLSLVQWGLDRRKHARLEAKKRRAASADWRGGW
jgi:ABC-type dipeptide/oligopeptide/nickel transport system permease subunit